MPGKLPGRNRDLNQYRPGIVRARGVQSLNQDPLSGKAFVSYARPDGPAVGKLVQRLERAGLDVWIDSDDLMGGDEWTGAIVKAIQTCDVFLVCLSTVSVVSAEVRKEVSLAHSRRKPTIPVLLEPFAMPEALEYPLAGLQMIDLAGDFAAGLDDVLRSVKKILAELPQKRFLGAESIAVREEREHTPEAKILRDAVFEKFNEKLRKSPPDLRFFQQKMFTLNHLNDLGISVAELKAALAQTGYYEGPVDDEFDIALPLAVSKLQRDHGLEMDGIFGRMTYAILSGLVKSSR
jgi:hypothetical protein